MRIGLDFDNTLATYDHVFASAAQDHGFIGKSTGAGKRSIRDRVRGLDDGETKWQALQGEVYGKRMKDAALIDGAGDFLRACKRHGAEVFIVSHKTEYGHYDAARVNLRDAARSWMTAHGFFDADGYGLDLGHVFFESTRPEKISRIGEIGCNFFVDDLEEVFAMPGFPDNVRRLLFDPSGMARPNTACEAHQSWQSIEAAVFTSGAHELRSTR